MTLVTRQAMTDDGGLFTTGTVVDEAFVDQLYDQMDDQLHSTTNTTTKPKAIIDEVILARGSAASLDARLDASLAADGSLAVELATITGGLRVGFAGTASADVIELGDANFNLTGSAGVPIFNWDTGSDRNYYTRAANLWTWEIGGTTVLSLNADGLQVAKGLIVGFSGTLIDDTIQIADSGLTIGLAAGVVTFVFDANDYFEYTRSSNTLDWKVGNTTVARFDAGLGIVGGLVIATASLVAATSGTLEMEEITAPAAPGSNHVRIYAQDNGAGKTQLMALFSSGAAQQLAIQP